MKLTKSILLGATILATALCSCGGSKSDHDHDDGPKDDGRRFAKLQYELEQAYEKYGYDSEEVKEISEKFDELAKKLQRKYERDTTGIGEFTEAYSKKLEELRERDGRSAFGGSYEQVGYFEEEASEEYEQCHEEEISTETLAY
jgi:lipoprotein